METAFHYLYAVAYPIIINNDEDFYWLVKEMVKRIREEEKADQENDTVTPQEAMKLLHIESPTTLIKLRNEGKIIHANITPRTVVYEKKSILDYIESKKHGKY